MLDMNLKEKFTRLIPGMRTIKTALAIIVCLFLYYAGAQFGIADQSDAFLACVAAIISMRDTVEKSTESGINRLAGTFLGAFLGLAYSLAELDSINTFLNIFVIAVGIVVLIMLCTFFQFHDSVVISCVVFLVIVLQQADADPLEHCIRRFVDTGMGIFISVLINHFIHNPKKNC